MKQSGIRGILPLVCLGIFVLPALPASAQETWNPKAAAGYLDSRLAWWTTWPTAARDHETFCVSCHTTAPYALGRPALRKPLGEEAASPNEAKLLDNVVKRVRMWHDVEPFYPDQTRGLPKTSESRGTESILNALILVWRDKAWRDRPAGHLSADARLALRNMWDLQLKSGEDTGAWAWLQFHNAPFEGDSQYYGTALAAIAIGSAPEGYLSEPEIQSGLELLRGHLLKNIDALTALDRVMLLWASANWPGLLTGEQRNSIVDQTVAKQREDGGFSLSSFLGNWERKDDTPQDANSDGYATGLVAFTLEQTGLPSAKAPLTRALSWLSRNQEKADGRWAASSLNKKRELSSDAGLFMSDAATAYAVLALVNAK